MNLIQTLDKEQMEKLSAGKTMPESSRYVRIASRTTAENEALVRALARVLGASVAR